MKIWYEVICDISQDTELLLGPKVPLLISDMQRDADDRSGSGKMCTKIKPLRSSYFLMHYYKTVKIVSHDIIMSPLWITENY